jgi:hypothetical protein
MRKLICAGLGALACLSIGSGTAQAQSPKAQDRTDPLFTLPSDAGALGGYNVLIADRGNNRLLLVSPAKTILWTYDFTGLAANAGADDAFFIEGGKRIIASLEHSQVIQIIDVATKQVVWEYGELGKRGSAPGYLNFPDDAYMLPNGDVMVADIRNCRILEIAPDKHIVRQAGVTRRCGSHAPYLYAPNGDTPLPNGHVLITTIDDHSLVELDENWKEIFRMVLTLHYPSDPQMTKTGNFLISDYSRPGAIVELDRKGQVVWSYGAGEADLLDRPSLAVELPNGNIIANDDLNHRIVVIDKATKRILWQYGVTGVRGTRPGYLHIPDGLDIIKAE